MNLQTFKNAVTSKVGRQVLIGKKHSPAILFGVGVTAMVGSTVLACNATLKVGDVLEKSEKLRQDIDMVASRPSKYPDYSTKDEKSDLYILKVQTAVKIGKLYAPAFAVGVLGIACLTGSHVVLTNRNTALMAAYATLDRGFKEYQNRVREAIGEDRERAIAKEGMIRKYKDNELPDEKFSALPGNYSMYARLWDGTTSSSYNKQPEYNVAFLTSQQNYMNNLLRSRGHVLLNEVYDSLGLDRTKEGCVVGWVQGNGDDYVDFGIFKRDDNGALLDFIKGIEDGIWIDPNVDGVVYDKI